MKILLCTPIYGRPEITKIWADNVWFKKVLCVLSPEDQYFNDNLDIVFKHKFFPIAWENHPLGAKMNALMHYTMNYDYDYVMNLDSDGVLHKSILDLYKPYFDAKKEFFGPDKVYFIDKKTGQIRHSKPNLWCSGRVISRKIIEKLLKNGENVYYSDENRGMDARSTEKVERLTFTKFESVPTGDFPYVLDIKTWDSLNDFNLIQNQSEECDQDIIKRNFDDKLLKLIYE